MKATVAAPGLEDKTVFHTQTNKINENSFEYRFYFNYTRNIPWTRYLSLGFIFYFVFLYSLMVNCPFNMFGFREKVYQSVCPIPCNGRSSIKRMLIVMHECLASRIND